MAERVILTWGAERIGDVVMTLPALKLIRCTLPNARITYVTSDYAAEVVRLTGLADEVIPLKYNGGLRNFRKYRRLRQRVQQGAFDHIVIFRKRATYRAWIGPASDPEEDPPGTHVAERNIRAVEKELGVTCSTIPSLRLELPDDPKIAQRFTALGLNLGHDRYIVVHPGCSGTDRKPWKTVLGRVEETLWPVQHYREVISRALSRIPSLKVVLIGTTRESPWVWLWIERKLRAGPRLINLSGRTTIREVLEILKHARLLLCTDSGVMHLGAAVGTPMVALFGKTDERKTGPLEMGDDVSLIRALTREEALRTPGSMARIEPVRVYEEIERRLLRP